jgi:transcriptional regulator with GAF, ATPase, and Fis domain
MAWRRGCGRFYSNEVHRNRKDDGTPTRSAKLGVDPTEGHVAVVVTNSGATTHPLPEAGEVVLGRHSSSGIAIDDDSVSRKHAILRIGNAGIEIEPLTSRNGTHVGGRALREGERVALPVGSVVELGMATLVVQRRSTAIEYQRFVMPTPRVQAGVQKSGPAGAMVVADDAMKKLHALIELVAPTPMSVLILGETGTGKEVIANAIHRHGARAGQVLLRLNCAALAESILEAELFGYERGAFTGAVQAKPGLFESADGGTVFLDEVGEMPPATQAKLLRVLESGEVLRLGALRSKHIDVRFLSATNRDLQREVSAQRFRMDLFFRLNGFTLTVPPLRDRPKDAEALARHFAREASQTTNRGEVMLLDDAVEVLRAHPWPGNIRELKSVIERATLFSKGGTLCADDIRRSLVLIPSMAAAPSVFGPGALRASGSLRESVDAFERQRIVEALEQVGGNQAKAAELLGMPRRTLTHRVAALGIGKGYRF